MSFLRAEWRKLVMVNYEVEPSILANYLPFGTKLDLWKGRCYVSLVGFMFLNTKLLGFRIPFHTNFEEVNLRFYVKRFDGNSWKRGVVFIKEIVPKHALTMVANMVYNENYETLPMRHKWEIIDDTQLVKYEWKKKGNWSSIKVVSEKYPVKIESGSKAEFITVHYWGYAKVSAKSTNEYEVTHPKWEIYNIIDQDIDVDFKSVYGQEFEFLKGSQPDSVMLAEGSEISVEPKIKIKNVQI